MLLCVFEGGGCASNKLINQIGSSKIFRCRGLAGARWRASRGPTAPQLPPAPRLLHVPPESVLHGTPAARRPPAHEDQGGAWQRRSRAPALRVARHLPGRLLISTHVKMRTRVLSLSGFLGRPKAQDSLKQLLRRGNPGQLLESPGASEAYRVAQVHKCVPSTSLSSPETVLDPSHTVHNSSGALQ